MAKQPIVIIPYLRYTVPMMLNLLKKHFGYDGFREGQETIISAILDGRDALAIMPTGAGKSICYQIPALLLQGITLVISPLISLMKDQVSALKQAGIAAAYLNSSLTQGQYRKALANAEALLYKVIYVAPERLETGEFQAFAARTPISLVAVDEAHCVSQWGQDFRPSYLCVKDFVNSLPVRPVVAAFTATATERVREDIDLMLGLRNAVKLVTGFDRKNLFFEIIRATEKEKSDHLLRIACEMRGKSGIVYCGTRKRVDEVTELLAKHGHPATRYHAGLDDAERQANQDAFLYDEKPIIVATNAFGMGIDKSNVSYVVHYNMPKDIESYYQEAGRAGRDGLPARCVLLYSKQDVILCSFLIEHSFEGEETSAAERQEALRKAKERLAQMTFYSTGNGCLRAFLLRYFGETTPARCESCSNCLRSLYEMDITDIAGTIVQCVMETGERYGIASIVSILCGSTRGDAAGRGLTLYRHFGALQNRSAGELTAIVQAMVSDEYLSIKPEVYRSLARGRLTREIEQGLRCVVRMPLVAEQQAREKKRVKPAPPAAAKAETAVKADTQLYEQLVRLRLEIARAQKVPAYVVFTNATLEAMCAAKPRTKEQMLAIPGVGERKYELFGDVFIEEIEHFVKNNPNVAKLLQTDQGSK